WEGLRVVFRGCHLTGVIRAVRCPSCETADEYDIGTQSQRDALPIRLLEPFGLIPAGGPLGAWYAQSVYWSYQARDAWNLWRQGADRKSTRLNSSHVKISYAVFCLI